ncbi:MAG: EamA family transporter [Nitrospirae bacterium]|nr:EamA family transporter [Nitrospirota bacterium]MBI5694731.1 EamA family transporter [Nitrospirota bacterium]
MWLILSVLSAFVQATVDAFTKKALNGADFYIVSWLRNLLAVPFLLAALWFVPIPKLDPTFYWACGLAMPLEVIATLMYIRALEISPMSLTMPFLALTPLYLLIFSYVLLGEAPSPAGLAGVLLLCAGAYLLNAHTLREGGIFAPFKAVYREKGSMLMMGVALIFAVTSDLSKLAIMHSSAMFFGVFYVAVFSFVFTPVALYFTKKPVSVPRSDYGLYIFIGATLALLAILQPLALAISHVSYMIAVKRLSLLFSIGYGYFMFGESHIKERLLGGAVMLLGLIVMTLM